jgi:hypothetical protein
MKLSTLGIIASLCIALAGQTFAQTAPDADAYRKAGAAYFKAGQFRESVQAYQQVIRLKPNDTAAYDQLGEAFTRLGMTKEAAAAFEKEADILLSGNGAPTAAPTPPLTQSAQNKAPQTKSQPPAGQHRVGERVDYVDNGVWFKAIIIMVRDDSAEHLDGKIYAPYRVHPLGYTLVADSWVCCLDFTDRRSQLNPAGSRQTEPVPGIEANDEVLKAMRGDPTSTVVSHIWLCATVSPRREPHCPGSQPHYGTSQPQRATSQTIPLRVFSRGSPRGLFPINYHRQRNLLGWHIHLQLSIVDSDFPRR